MFGKRKLAGFVKKSCGIKKTYVAYENLAVPEIHSGEKKTADSETAQKTAFLYENLAVPEIRTGKCADKGGTSHK